MIVYILPIIIFLIVVSLMYYFSKDPNKDELDTILIKNIVPGVAAGVITYFIVKYKDDISPDEEIMTGNYFD